MILLILEEAMACDCRVQVLFMSEAEIKKIGYMNEDENWYPKPKMTDHHYMYNWIVKVSTKRFDIDFNDQSHSHFRYNELAWCIDGYVSEENNPEYFI